MPKSQYIISNPAQNSERRLIESISQEQINLFGVEVYIIPNEYNNVDAFFREDRMPELTKAFKLPVMFQNAQEGYSGEAAFSKFGFVNHQEFDFVVSAKEWRETAALNGVIGPGAIRPMEGYIVYVPTQDEYPDFGASDFFRIRYIDKFEGNGWFPLGVHHTLLITCEKWSYSSENLATGVPAIDANKQESSLDVTVRPDVNTDPWANNNVVQSMSDSFVAFDETNPFGKV